jgi:hypothetical protein
MCSCTAIASPMPVERKISLAGKNRALMGSLMCQSTNGWNSGFPARLKESGGL